jgi:hypothetical protein
LPSLTAWKKAALDPTQLAQSLHKGSSLQFGNVLAPGTRSSATASAVQARQAASVNSRRLMQFFLSRITPLQGRKYYITLPHGAT